MYNIQPQKIKKIKIKTNITKFINCNYELCEFSMDTRKNVLVYWD